MSDDHDYAHMRDPEAQRTRAELWAIVLIVVVVIGGALVWRVVAHKPAQPQKGWNMNTQGASSVVSAAAGIHPTSPPPPRPIAP